MKWLVSRSGIVKKCEFLRPFSKATEKTEKIMFCFGSALYWTENEKFVYNNQQCFAFQIQMLTTSCRILTSIPPSSHKSLTRFHIEVQFVKRNILILFKKKCNLGKMKKKINCLFNYFCDILKNLLLGYHLSTW